MNPPSPQLIETLTRLELVHHRDFARCSGYVRQFARDLPTFDSVWVDGLVRNGTLSRFQARQIQAGHVESLRAGPWLLLDRIQSATRLEVFRARHASSGQLVTLTRLSASNSEAIEADERLQDLLKTTTSVRSQLTSPPQATFAESDAWWIVGPASTGIPLDGLLVRRGRFPADIVHLIAVRLSHELALLHRLSHIHGDLRPANIRLTSRGQLELSHHGVLRALEPGRPLLARLPLEYFDGLAPERIETELDARSLASSEVYALGCLLWQLLVGRAPYPMADPLLKMSAHRAQRVPPVRDWAPHTPERLASLIDRATQRDPARRPTMEQLKTELATPVTAGRERFVRFLNGFESASPRPLVQHDPTAELTGPWKVAGQGALVTASLVLLGAGLFWGPGLWNSDSIGPPQAAATTEIPQETLPRVTAEAPSLEKETLLDLPAPDSQGYVRLEARRYRASTLTAFHTLTLEGTAEAPAEIVVEAAPLALQAQQVLLQHVRVTCQPAFAEPPIQITAQDLRLGQFQVLGESSVSEALLDWRLANPADVTAGHLQVTDTVFQVASDIFSLQFPLQAASFDNVLQAGGGSLLSLNQGVRPGARVPVILNNCTLRDTGAPVRWLLHTVSPNGQLSLQGRDSILALRPDTALIEFTAGRLSTDWEQHLQIAAEGLIVDQKTAVAGYRYESDAAEFRSLNPKVMQIDGLLTGTVEFRGSKLRSVDDSLVRTATVPLRQADQQLGFDATAIR